MTSNFIMYFLFRIIIICLFLFTFVYSLDFNLSKSDIQINFEDELVENINFDKTKRKSLFAAGLSAVLPGAGQFYLGDNIAGSIYIAVEASLWLTRDHYLDESVLSSEAYKEYARNHWDFSKWIRDYHNPSMLPAFTDVDFIGEKFEYTRAFILDADDIYNNFLISGPDPDSLYFHLLWSQGHSAEFDYEGTIVSTADDAAFIPIYLDICNTSAELNYICLLDIESYSDIDDIPIYGTDLYYSMLLEQINNRMNGVIYDHHLYEGIGKYNMFFAGWDDSMLGDLVVGSGGFNILNSPHKSFYEHTLRAGHKENNDKAGNLLSLLLVNRAISMFNILLNESRLSVSSDVNPSKYGNNEIKLSLGF